MKTVLKALAFVDLANMSEILNMSGLMDSVIDAFSEPIYQAVLDALDPLMSFLKVLGIAFLIYLVFLIIKAISQIKFMRQMSLLSKNVDQINNKFSVIIKKMEKEDKKERKIKIL